MWWKWRNHVDFSRINIYECFSGKRGADSISSLVGTGEALCGLLCVLRKLCDLWHASLITSRLPAQVLWSKSTEHQPEMTRCWATWNLQLDFSTWQSVCSDSERWKARCFQERLELIHLRGEQLDWVFLQHDLTTRVRFQQLRQTSENDFALYLPFMWIYRTRLGLERKKRSCIKCIFIMCYLRVGMLMSAYVTKRPTAQHCSSDVPTLYPQVISPFCFFLISSGAAEGSVWNMVTKAPSPPTATGQTGLPGLLAPGPAEEGCLTGIGSAQTPGERPGPPSSSTPISLLRTFQTACGHKLSENNSVPPILL